MEIAFESLVKEIWKEESHGHLHTIIKGLKEIKSEYRISNRECGIMK